ncbi:MAG: O-antigen ligase family protein, partial [Solirubrobacteraceae bacterium]|nr:O-antigen ligase family protein [Solirubrobacteraceae bacterium]
MTSVLAISALGDAAQTVGVIVAALCAAAAICAPGPKLRALAVLGALVLAALLLGGHVWTSPQVEELRDRPMLLAIGAAAGLVGLAVGAWLLDRYPTVFPLAVAAALPFRVPIEAGGDTANLLVPLYLVIGAGALAYAIPRLRGQAREELAPGVLEWLLGGAVVLYALQAAYSGDFDRALQQLVFFYVPFAVLFALLQRVQWTAKVLAGCLGVLVVLALAFVAVGFYEYATRELLLNPKVINANEFATYFRVNSLFFDPNIYGRFLAVVMLLVTAAMLWTSRVRDAVVGVLVLVILWGGLVVTFSQSSFAGLLAGLAVLGGLRWGWKRAAIAVTGVVVAGALVIVLASGSLRLELGDSDSVSDATSGRADLIEGGVQLAQDKPIQGWGSGSFRHEYRANEKASDQRATAASHTIPVTVAAEQGVIGLAVYLALLIAALARLFGSGLVGALREPTAVAIARAGVVAAFIAILVHTMLYAAFLEDPLVWALLGAGVALARGGLG